MMNNSIQHIEPAVSRLTQLAVVICLTIISTMSNAAPVLNAITYSTDAKDNISLRLELSEPVGDSRSFAIDNPPRIAVDLPSTKLAVAERLIHVDSGNVRNVRSVEAGGKTRVVFDLVKMSPYTLRAVGSTLILSFDGAAATSSPLAKNGRQEKRPAKKAKTIDAIDFRRGTEAQGRLLITLSDPASVIDVDERLGKIHLRILATRLPEKLERRLDVTDFATPITTVDAVNVSDGTEITLSTHGEYQYMAYQAGEVYSVEVRPMTKEEVDAKKEKYTGEKLSLNFQNIEVRAVLQLMADFTGLNIVASDTVQGSITLRLKNVPWDQAMDIVLKTRGLGMRRNGDVIMVAPNAELTAMEEQELKARKQIEEVMPLRTRFYVINYAKAGDIAKLLKGDKNTILSSRGHVSIDERTNTLMVLETEDKHAELQGLIKRLDIPVRQVLIESRVVIATNQFGKDLGAQFGVTEISNNPPRKGGRGALITSGSHPATSQIAENVIFDYNDVVPNPAVLATDQTVDQHRLNTRFPAAGNAGRIALAILGVDYLVELELSALQREGKGEVLSNPRVMTANQKEAKIEQGVEIPYLQASASGATNIAFKKAVLSLSVTPQITPDDRVIMDLKVNKDSVGQIFNGVPSINKREVDTQVLVGNGETVVLGGIYEQENSSGEEKIPLLGDIPILGYLFRHRTKSEAQTELLIFVTPKIVKEGLQASVN